MAFVSIDQTEPIYPDFPQGIQIVSAKQGIANIDCSGNPNYPAAVWGSIYLVTVAGKIGGSNGIDVTIEQLARIKATITKMFGVVIAGQTWDMLEKTED